MKRLLGIWIKDTKKKSMSTYQHCLSGRRLHYPGCQRYGGPKGSITNQFPKTQISLPKHKPISQNKNQFTKTQTNFPKHKSKYWALAPWLSESAWKELIPRIFCFQYSDFYSAVEVFTKMFCHNCGSELLEEYLYCSPYGKKLIHKTLLTTRSQKWNFKKGHKPSCSLGQWKLTNTDFGLSRIVYGKCNSIPSEINTTMYLQTKRFIRSTERNKRNKLLC